MRRKLVLGALLVFGSLSLTVAALQQPPGPSAAGIEVEKLQDNLYILKSLASGGGGNTALFITATGAVVVDTKNPGWGQPLLDTIKTLTDKPVTMIINTHSHGDHVSGNVEFPATIDVVAHEKTKSNMEAMRPASFAAPRTGAAPPSIFDRNQGRNLPKRTFKDKMTIGNGAERIELYYFGRAHTDGDAMVFFPTARVVHMADVFPAKALPGIDGNNGGSGVEYAPTLTKIANWADSANVDTIINGHYAATTSRAELREFISFVQEFVKTAQDAKKAGKTVDDVVAEWKTPAKYAGYEAPVAARVRAAAAQVFSETR